MDLERQELLERCRRNARPDDLRFGFPAHLGATLAEAVRAPDNAAALAADQRLLDAFERTFVQDVRDIARVLARRRYVAYPSSIPNATRAVAQRFGAVPGGTSFTEIGGSLGRTKQRAEALFKTTVSVARDASVLSPPVEAVLQRLNDLVPVPLSRADAALRALLGRSSVLDVLEFVRQVQGRAAPFDRRSVPQEHDHSVFEPLLERVGSDSVQRRTAWSVALALCLGSGVTHLARVAGELALDHGITLSRDALVQLLEQHPSFRWLDDAKSWFALRDGRPSVIESRIAKVFCVAREPIALQRLMEILARDRILSEHPDAGLPPGPVLDALLSGWTWLSRSAAGAFTRVGPIDDTVALSDVERAIVRAIDSAGGAAPVDLIREHTMVDAGVSRHAVWKALMSSPIFERRGRATYGVIFRAPG